MLNEDEDLGFSASTQRRLNEIASRLKGIAPSSQLFCTAPENGTSPGPSGCKLVLSPIIDNA